MDMHKIMQCLEEVGFDGERAGVNVEPVLHLLALARLGSHKGCLAFSSQAHLPVHCGPVSQVVRFQTIFLPWRWPEPVWATALHTCEHSCSRSAAIRTYSSQH